MKLSVDVPQETLPRIWRRWERVEAVKLEQSDDGRITLLVTYDAAETARGEFELQLGELGEAA